LSDPGEIRADAERIRRELISLMTDLRALDMSIQDVVNRQASLKAAVILSLDHLDRIDARLRKL
jgi:hypothetical protein